MKVGLFAMAVCALFSFLGPLGNTFNISSFAPIDISVQECVAGAYDDDECGDEFDSRIIPAAASSNSFTTYDNFAQAYFKGLTSNFGI